MCTWSSFFLEPKDVGCSRVFVTDNILTSTLNFEISLELYNCVYLHWTIGNQKEISSLIREIYDDMTTSEYNWRWHTEARDLGQNVNWIIRCRSARLLQEKPAGDKTDSRTSVYNNQVFLLAMLNVRYIYIYIPFTNIMHAASHTDKSYYGAYMN